MPGAVCGRPAGEGPAQSARPGPGQHREPGAPVRAGRAGGRAGLEPGPGPGGGRRPGPVRGAGSQPRGLPGAGGPGRAGPGRAHPRPGGEPARQKQLRLVSATGPVRDDRHAERRRRRQLRPGGRLRPAGAFAFGRTRKAGRTGQPGQPACGRRPVPMAQWEVLICGHHPGYITWEEYLANQERLHANCSAPRGQGGGAVREGRGLLQGIVRCGRCGRMMRVGYQASRAKHSTRYYCAAPDTYLGRQAYCQGVGGRQIEQAVTGEVLAVLEPAALAATAQALADAEAARAQRLRAFELAAERARYEAGRARRQYDACEPENRLVARSLEAAWADKLAAVDRDEAPLATALARQPSPLSAEEMDW